MARVTKEYTDGMMALLSMPRRIHVLEAYSKSCGQSEHTVRGWLARKIEAGEVRKIEIDSFTCYVAASSTVHEVPEPSIYPSWLDPRTLPISRSRVIVSGGEIVLDRK